MHQRSHQLNHPLPLQDVSLASWSPATSLDATTAAAVGTWAWLQQDYGARSVLWLYLDWSATIEPEDVIQVRL